MSAVADLAGVSRRAIYLHFPSRSELVAALFPFVTEEEGLQESMEHVWKSPDSVAALDAWARHISRFHPRVMAVTKAVEQVYRHDADAAMHRELYLQDQMTACIKLASWLEHEGRLAAGWTATSASHVLWALISVEMLERLLIELRWSTDQFALHLAHILKATFVAYPLSGPENPDE